MEKSEFIEVMERGFNIDIKKFNKNCNCFTRRCSKKVKFDENTIICEDGHILDAKEWLIKFIDLRDGLTNKFITGECSSKSQNIIIINENEIIEDKTIFVHDDETIGTDDNDVIIGRDDGIKNGNRIGDGDAIFAGRGDDRVTGNVENEYIHGGDGNDIIHGGKGHDYILGESGDDVLVGESGNDVIVGGSGTDVAIMSGKREDYKFTEYDSGWKKTFLEVKDTRASYEDGTDFVKKDSTEFIQFSNGTFKMSDRSFTEGLFIYKK